MQNLRAIVLWLSFLVFVTALAGSKTPFRDLDRDIRSAKSASEIQKALDRHPEALKRDPKLKDKIDPKRLKAMIKARAIAEGGANAPQTTDPSERVKSLKKSRVYVDSGETNDSNWFGKSIERAARLFKRKEQEANNIRIRPPNLGGASVLFNVVVWAVILAAVSAFIWFVATRFRWVWKKRVKAVGGMLADDEPDRTADEWLTEAERLRAEGKLREAIRCMYLAILVRLDDSNVARLIRTETNWEHYRRIVKSPKCPPGLDFQDVTQRFDWAWYGYRVRGPEDLDHFVAFYTQLMAQLKEKAAS